MKSFLKFGRQRKFDNILLWICNTVYNQNARGKWTKGWILLFVKEGAFRIIKNCRGIALSVITAKDYYALFFNCIQPEIKKVLGKNQNGFWRNCTATSQILTICQIIKGVQQRILRQHDCLQISLRHLFSYIKNKYFLHMVSPPNVTVIMMFYKIMKEMVCTPDTDTNFDILARRYIRIIFVSTLPHLDTLNIHRSNKRNWFQI